MTEAIYLGFSLEQLVSLQNKQIQASPLDCPICVPRTRLAFIDEFSEVRNAPTHGNFLAYLGPNVEVFTEVFEDLVGAVR